MTQKKSAVSSVAGALSSANAENYAVRKVKTTYGIAIRNCTNVASALAGGLPTRYSITSRAVNVNVTSVCILRYTPISGATMTANFIATGVN